MLNNTKQKPIATLRQSIDEAKRIYKNVTIKTALSKYAQLLDKIIQYAGSSERQNEAYYKLQLVALILNAFEPEKNN